MSKTKTVFKWFSLTQYDQEAAYLRDMHRQGWQLTRIGFPGWYHFEACVPEDVVYQLDYNQEGVAHKDEYTRMFADCGWTYLFDFVGYSYFRKPAAAMDGDEEIFCDDESRLAMIGRIFKGRVLPLLGLFFPLLTLCGMMGAQMAAGPEHAIQAVLFLVLLAEIILYLAIFVWFGLAYLKMKRRAEE